MDFSSETGTLNILLVEDNPGDVVLIREVFNESGQPFHLSVAVDGQQALDLLMNQGWASRYSQPNLVLLDLNLPKKGGLEVLREIKASKSLRHIVVVILSASNLPADIKAGYELYANAYIQKPANLDEYSIVVRTIQKFWMEIAELPVGKGFDFA